MKETTERISRARFIRLGAALGMSVVGAAVLAACGEEPAERSSNGAANGNKIATKGQGANAGNQEIAQTSKVPVGSAVNFKEAGSPAVLVHLKDGNFAAYSAVCTHQGCTVTYQHGQLFCPCHGSVFDPSRGGAVLSGPAPSPLPRIPVKVQKGGVYRA